MKGNVAHNQNFDKLCHAIAEYLAGKKLSNAPTTEKLVQNSTAPNKKYRLMIEDFRLLGQTNSIPQISPISPVDHAFIIFLLYKTFITMKS